MLAAESNEKYANELEHQIFDRSNKPTTDFDFKTVYYKIFIKIFHALKNNKSLVEIYSPSELILIEDSALIKNTSIVNCKQQYKQEYDQYKQILNQSSSSLPEDSGFICKNPKCGNRKKFQVILKQTRSADEPMTQFIRCSECGQRYRR